MQATIPRGRERRDWNRAQSLNRTRLSSKKCGTSLVDVRLGDYTGVDRSYVTEMVVKNLLELKCGSQLHV